ncbi:hypothetical protein R3P38DRAFT_3574554 [Favolaschia claudopus]|uniref:Uncharacterized protein n=1 Tax=Favolaschia claudopus TaxID=2862362 RepID=A0AAW0APL6_9AGAR
MPASRTDPSTICNKETIGIRHLISTGTEFEEVEEMHTRPGFEPMQVEFSLESRLATLPVSLRRLTRIVLAPSTTPETVSQTLYRILLDCQRARDNGLTARSLLPLVNVILDPADLPDPETALESNFRERVISAGHALAILNCTGPRHASPALLEITPRIWAWIRFMHIYEYFPGMELDYCLLLSTLHPISYLDVGRDLLHTTPDICFFIGSTWERIVSMCERGTLSLNDFRCRRAIHFLGIFLTNHISPQHSGELVDGAGGEKKLARLIVKYLGLVLKALEVEQIHEHKKALSLTLECTIAFTSHYIFVSREALLDAGFVGVVAQAAVVFPGAGYASEQHHQEKPPLVIWPNVAKKSRNFAKFRPLSHFGKFGQIILLPGTSD